MLHIGQTRENLHYSIHSEGPHAICQGKPPKFIDASSLPDGTFDSGGTEHKLMDGDTPLIAAPSAIITTLFPHNGCIHECWNDIRHMTGIMAKIL
jgi:hypothetical protein